MNGEFLPVSREDMLERGWYYYDFLLVTGDAYVDHPSFGTPLIGRILEEMGFRAAILAQPGGKMWTIKIPGRMKFTISARRVLWQPAGSSRC